MADKNWGFGDEVKKDSDYFNFKEGEVKLRVLTHPVPVRQYFKDGQYVTVEESYQGPEKVSMKGWAWCFIGGELKIVKFPYSIIKEVQKFMVDEEYAFDGFPMPYDLTITATGEGMERRYSVLASRKNTPIDPAALEALEKKTSIADIIAKMKEKKDKGDKKEVKKGHDYPENELDEAPF